MQPPVARLFVLALVLLLALPAHGSSHRDAPALLGRPRVDATDLYVFRSYESGREGFTTLIANYAPFQDPVAGPNYFPLDPEARYGIHIDADGDGRADVSFVFEPAVRSRELALPVGRPGEEVLVPVPVQNLSPVFAEDDSALNEERWVRLEVVRGNEREPARRVGDGSPWLPVPFDYVGEKTFPDYEGYAAARIHDVLVPGCGHGRVFVGPRQDPFAVNLGELFDLVNLAPLFPVDDEVNDLELHNVTSLAIEVPTACLTEGGDGVIGAWTTASLPGDSAASAPPATSVGRRVPVRRTPREDRRQVSRLGNPLVSELLIGVPDKDAFNAGRPSEDSRFERYLTHPALPEILEMLFPDELQAPDFFPRHDLLAVFFRGVPGVNETGAFGDMLRLNTALPPTPIFEQDPLGLLGGDPAGFPNGRRPGDDVVDAVLRLLMGGACHRLDGLCDPGDAPSGGEEITDGAFIESGFFLDAFPYLNTPIPGSPNGEGST